MFNNRKNFSPFLSKQKFTLKRLKKVFVTQGCGSSCVSRAWNQELFDTFSITTCILFKFILFVQLYCKNIEKLLITFYLI